MCSIEVVGDRLATKINDRSTNKNIPGTFVDTKASSGTQQKIIPGVVFTERVIRLKERIHAAIPRATRDSNYRGISDSYLPIVGAPGVLNMAKIIPESEPRD